MRNSYLCVWPCVTAGVYVSGIRVLGPKQRAGVYVSCYMLQLESLDNVTWFRRQVFLCSDSTWPCCSYYFRLPYRCIVSGTMEYTEGASGCRAAEALPKSMLQSRTTSTTRKCLGTFKRWKSWATEHQLVMFSIEATNLALYLQYLGESKSAVEEAVHGLSWTHTMVDIPTPTSSPFVQATLEGILSKPFCKKSTFTVEMLQAIVHDAKKADTLSSLHLVAVLLISFAGFLCFDEVANIRPCDLAISEDYLTIQIPYSKTDQI